MPFDYTAAQWQEIRSAVRDGCAQPAAFNEAGLLRAANEYVTHRPHYRSAQARAAAWARVARLVRQTREAIAAADPLGSWDRVARLFDDPPRLPPEPEYSLSDELKRWQRFAALLGRHRGDERHPRAEFFQSVLDYWTDVGGWLRSSRAGPDSRDAGRPGGPTLRYLRAVSDPVLSKDALTPEGLRKVLLRCASEFEALLAVDAELASGVEAVQNGTIPTRPTRHRRQGIAEVRSRARRLARGPRRGASAKG
jgi:hypothetical protein